MSSSYRDIYNELKTKPVFQAQVKALVSELQVLESRSPTPSNVRKKRSLLLDMYRLCDFNPSFLVPYYFPRYPSNKPLSPQRRPFSVAMFHWMMGGYLCIKGSRQLGKCRSLRDTASVWDKHGQPLRPDELRVGQEILSVDDRCMRTSSKIIRIHQAGHLEVFRVTLRSGRTLLLSGGHGLRKLSGWDRVENLKPGDRIAAMRLGGVFGHRREPRERIILTAYMLGDGSCVSGNFDFTSACPSSLDEFQSLAEPLQRIPVRRYRKPDSTAWSVSMSQAKSSQLRVWLEQDGTWGNHSWEKKIPTWVYELNQEDTRLFLSRLWATDGSVIQPQTQPEITFAVTSERLAEGVQSLLCKFGIESNITSKTGILNGVKKRKSYCVRVKGRPSWKRFMDIFSDIPGRPTSVLRIPTTKSNNNDDVLPKEIHAVLDGIREACKGVPGAAFKSNGLSIKRGYCPNREKLERYLLHGDTHVPHDPHVAELRHWLHDASVSWSQIKSVEYVGLEPCWDIEVEDTHTYVLDGLVSHNSTNFSARQLINANNIPRWASMYVCPHTDHKSTYGTRLREMEMAFRFYKKHPDLRQNLYLKEYPNGSKIELVRALTSAAHIRGKTNDEVVYDEYQLFDVSLEGEIDQTMKASEARIRIYAGTSTTIDSPLEERYSKASQGHWHVRGSRGWIDFGDVDMVEKMIRPEGLVDPWSERLIDVTNGRWVHHQESRLAMNLISIHVPQIIIPDFVYDYQQWSDIYRAFCEYDRPLFRQEILGISTESGAREITQKDLERICVLGSQEDCMRNVKEGRYKWVVSGFDWGGADHRMASNIKTSYTVHVILGVTFDGEMHILKMTRRAGMNYRDLMGKILADHFAFGGNAIASDSGGGQIYNQMLREDPRVDPDRHFIFHYTSPNTAMLASPSFADAMYNEWMLNRTEAITATYEFIKDPSMPAKCYNWGKAKDYLDDFLNSYRVVSERMGGARYFRFIRPPSKADDCLHAFTYAKVLAQVLLGQPIAQDPSVARTLAQRLNTRTAGTSRGRVGRPHMGHRPTRFSG